MFYRLIAPIERLVAALCDPRWREHTVIVVLTVYVAIWTFYAILAKASQDLHPDMAEIVGWSRNVAFGYWKHPPVAPWLTAFWFKLLPEADWSFYLLAMTIAGLALWIAWRTASYYLDAEKRVLAVALLTLVPFFNFHALKFNANVALMPLWGATTLCFLRSFERLSMKWAALAGLFAATAMLGKYWSIFLLAGLGIAALSDSRRSVYFRSLTPWVTIGIGAVAIAPHIVWLGVNQFTPFFHAINVHTESSVNSMLDAGRYVMGSLGYVALPVVLALFVMRPNYATMLDTLWPPEPTRRLAVVAFWSALLLPVPIAMMFNLSLTPLWSMSAWTLLPVVLLSSPSLSLHREAMLTTVAIAVAFPLVMLLAAPGIAVAIHRGSLDPVSTHMSILAKRVEREWRSISDQPLQIIGGDTDIAYGVAFYLPNRPLTLVAQGFGKLPLSENLERVRRAGIAIVCSSNDKACEGTGTLLGSVAPPRYVEIARTFRGIVGRSAQYTIILQPPARLGQSTSPTVR